MASICRLAKHFLIQSCLVLGVFLSVSYAQVHAQEHQEYPDPQRYNNAIQQFEEADRDSFPPAQAILVIGSSSIRGWHGHIHQDLPEFTIIPRGFGGSHMNDVLYFADRIVIPYKPRAIVLYEGENDIAHGIPPEVVVDTFQTLIRNVHQALPDTRIYVLSIKPSIRRWDIWPEMRRANELIREICRQDERLIFVDVSTGMLGSDGTPREDIFVEDLLHMNRKGYKIWLDALRPVLQAYELPDPHIQKR